MQNNKITFNQTLVKKLAAIMLTAVMLLGMGSGFDFNKDNPLLIAPITAEAYSGGNYKVNTRSGVNVRSGAGTSYKVKGSATNGTSFTVVEVNGNWGKTNSINCTNGYQSGWVCLSYCSYVSSGSSGSSSSSKTGKGVVYNCSYLNVRKKATTSSNIITSLKCGTEVNILYTSGNWGYDTSHGGFVSLKYINFNSSGGGSGSSNNTVNSSNNYVTIETKNREYVFEPQCASNKVLDITGWGKNNCTNVQIWQFENQANQLFKAVSMGNGYYAFMDTNSGKVLDVSGGNAYDGANVIIYDYHGGANQQWRIIPAGKTNGQSYYYIQSKINSNYYLDVNGACNYNGCNVQLYKGNGTSAQKFRVLYKKVSNTKPDPVINNNTGGYSSFKPRQQKNYSYSICENCRSNISSSGCGPIATVNAVGYLTGREMDIATVASTTKRNGMHCCGSGCYHSVSRSLIKSLGSTYGVKVTDNYSFGSKRINGNSGYPTQSQYDALWSDLVSHLKKGEVAVTLVHGHFIAIVAYDSSTGKVLVYDSAASSSRGTTTNGDWKSYNELNCNSSSGYQKLKLRAYITFIARA